MRRIDLSPEDIATLEQCASEGLTLTSAGKQLGMCAATIRRAARRQGLGEWLSDRFPATYHRSRCRELALDGIQHAQLKDITPVQAPAGSLCMRWLTGRPLKQG